MLLEEANGQSAVDDSSVSLIKRGFNGPNILHWDRILRRTTIHANACALILSGFENQAVFEAAHDSGAKCGASPAPHRHAPHRHAPSFACITAARRVQFA